MALPVKETPETLPDIQGPTYLTYHPTPESRGAALGAGMTHAGAELTSVVHGRRVLTAQFDAFDRETAFGKDTGDLLINFEKNSKGLNNADLETATSEARSQIEDLRMQHLKMLSDPLAQRYYTSRTRLRTEHLYQRLGEIGLRQQNDFMSRSMKSGLEQFVKDAGTVTGDPQRDIENLGKLVAATLGPYEEWLMSQGFYTKNEKGERVPDATAKHHIEEVEADGIRSMLTAYGNDYAGAMRILNDKTIQTILGGAAVAKLRDHYTKVTDSEEGTVLGETLAMQFPKRPDRALAKLDEMQKAKMVTPVVAAKTRAHLTTIFNEKAEADHTREVFAFRDGEELLAKKYGYSIEKMESGDPNYWQSLPAAVQINLRKVAESMNRRDPTTVENSEFTGFLEKITANPAIFDKMSAAELRNEWLPKVGAFHWPKVEAEYQRLRSRNREDDPGKKMLDLALEMRLRSKLGHPTDPMNPAASHPDTWPEKDQYAYIWGKEQFRRFIVGYETSKAKHERLPPMSEALKAINEIVQNVDQQRTILGMGAGHLGTTQEPVAKVAGAGGRVPYANIPEEDRKAIRTSLTKTLGKEPDNKQVEDLYMQRLQNLFPQE